MNCDKGDNTCEVAATDCCPQDINFRMEKRNMWNQANGLRVAHTDKQKRIPDVGMHELAQRFSFRPLSEKDAAEHAVRVDTDASASRRALLDKRLLEEIYERVAMQGDLETAQLQLHACNGIVTIEGLVADRAMRARIGNFIRRCSVAKKVINRVQTRDSHPTREELQDNWKSSWRTG